MHPRPEAVERSIVYCVPYSGRPDDSGFTLAGKNSFLSRKRVVSRSTKMGVSFTNHVAQRALERWGAKESPAQAVAAALVEQIGLIACFFRHAARHGAPNETIPGLDSLLLGEIYQPIDQSIRRGQNAQIDRHMSNTYISGIRSLAFVMEFAMFFHDYRLRR